MYGLLFAIIVFNIVAFKKNKTFTYKEIAHLWVFTIAFQVTFDSYVDLKYHAYWYFTQSVDWADILTVTVLIPPVNMMFLNWFPFQRSLFKKFIYFSCWEVILLAYELLTLLPKPLGYFHYGWWHLGISLGTNPILLLILLFYYKKFIDDGGKMCQEFR